MFKKIIQSKFWWAIVIVLMLLLNYVAALFHTRIDLTSEKRFTLSAATKKLLRKPIEGNISIDVFLKGTSNAGFKQLGNASNDILQEFKEVAGNKIQFNFLDPADVVPSTEVTYADTLTALGLLPINLTSQVKEGQQQQYVFPFALVHYQDKTFPVELYKGKTPIINFAELSSAEALLEYKFAEAISKITQTQKPIIGYAVGNGEADLGRLNTYDLVENVLKPDYQLFTFDLNSPKFIPTAIQALVIVKPTIGFSDEAKLKLDQYVMNGGKLLVFVDRLNAELDSLQSKKGQVTAFDRDLKLNDLFFNYGARVNADLLMDLQCDFLPFDVSGNGQFELLPWNYFPVIDSKSNHPINKGIGYVAAKFANTIDTVEAEGIKKTILLSSSANARTIGSPAIISVTENVNAPDDAKFKKANLPIAVLLEGKFKSMFANRLSTAMSDTLAKYNIGFMPQSLTEGKIIIVADGDMVLNAVVKGNPIPMGMNVYTFDTQREFPFANKAFLQNALNYLVGDDGLSEAKAKDYTVKLLDTKKTADQKLFWQTINIVIPIVTVMLFALIFQWLRKRKYTLS
ncbi:gliding motility-associated ABC transporter substrate-binding protein GldG [Ferruginibacter yonginensis]|uniref:Gliding motility-associated ABC transporter substrate-binding protein GldG n=1 Tax=Ferruginibacter yonginensis TaxID=1310416 RepID=A0ABV8QRC5_9BACT